jgi:hypothetical protein
MFAVHNALRGSFDLVEGLVERAGSDPVRAAVVADFYDNVLEFLHVHHVGEDELVYPLLEARCTELEDLLERIDAQHRTLDAPMQAAWDAVAAYRAQPSAETGAGLAAAIEHVEAVLVPHLHEEEALVVPLATRWLSPEEWGELPGHAMGMFSKDKPWLALGLVREHLTDEQRAGMLEGMPPPVRDMWTNEWEPAFNAFMSEVRA